MRIVLVIGNGFDLDLGLKTQFSHFAESPLWPERPAGTANMYDVLNRQKKISKWLDLEQLLVQYASNRNGSTSPAFALSDKSFYNKLSNALSLYLKDQQESEIRKSSNAAKLLEVILSVHHWVKIYSFNYTDLHLLANKLGLTPKFTYEHVHGSLKDDSVILGIPDSADVHSNYEFLYKTFNKNYSSHEILYDLLDADEVIFFGHSLSPVDYHYFQRFFRMQCRSDMKRSEGKRITIFTYDETARISILKQLREMNDKRTDLLMNQNAFQIFMTDGCDDDKIEMFFNDFSKRVKKGYILDALKVAKKISFDSY